jgi:hypothetical protein
VSQPSTEAGLQADATSAPPPSASEATSEAPYSFDLLRAGRVALRRLRCCVQAYVGTHHVHAELRVRGPSLRWLTRHTARQPVGAMGATGLSAALEALDMALQDCRSAAAAEVGADFGGAPCQVILADAWVVYDVIPVDLAMLTPALAHQAVAAALGEVLGAPSAALSVRWQRRRDGRGAFGMALSGDDLARVRQTVTAHRLRLSGVTGEFVAVLNRQRSTVPAERAVVAVVREAGTQLAALVGGEVALAQFETGLADASSLPIAAQRALSARGLDTTSAIDFCVDLGRSAPAVDLPAAGDWHWWPTPSWVHAPSAGNAP